MKGAMIKVGVPSGRRLAKHEDSEHLRLFSFPERLPVARSCVELISKIFFGGPRVHHPIGCIVRGFDKEGGIVSIMEESQGHLQQKQQHERNQQGDNPEEPYPFPWQSFVNGLNYQSFWNP